MWVKRVIVLAAILVMAPAAPVAAGMMMGQTPPGGQPDGMGGGRMERGMHGGRMASHEGPLLTMMLRHGQELGLTPEQERKLRDLRTEFSKETVRRSAEIRVAQIEMDALLEQSQWDVAQLEAKARSIATLRGDLRVARLKTLAAGRALLTPAQLETFRQVGHRMRSMGGPGGMRHGMMGPGSPSGASGQAPAGPPAQHQH